jgi:purine-nucleoside phosphorylase
VSYEQLRVAADAVAATTGVDHHDAAVVLGSGLGSYPHGVSAAVEVPYGEIPGFPVPRVEGHGGSLFSFAAGGSRILALSGRVHTYEGWELGEVVFGVRTAAMAGARTVLLTNAAGGVGEGMAAGDLVAIRDHLNLTGRNPLVGSNDDRLGPRFPDLSLAYSPALRHRMRAAFDEAGVTFREGVYAWFLGPSYETPAEVQMAKRLGADLVGMSTVPEAIALRHMGVEVGGISLVTNLAAGISAQPLSHEEVTATADAASARFTAVLDALLPRLAGPTEP